MAEVLKPRIGTTARSSVAISNTAAHMLSALYDSSPDKVQAAISDIASDIEDPRKVDRVAGYEDVFVARGHGMRVVFTRRGSAAVVTSVSAEG